MPGKPQNGAAHLFLCPLSLWGPCRHAQNKNAPGMMRGGTQPLPQRCPACRLIWQSSVWMSNNEMNRVGTRPSWLQVLRRGFYLCCYSLAARRALGGITFFRRRRTGAFGFGAASTPAPGYSKVPFSRLHPCPIHPVHPYPKKPSAAIPDSVLWGSHRHARYGTKPVGH